MMARRKKIAPPPVGAELILDLNAILEDVATPADVERAIQAMVADVARAEARLYRSREALAWLIRRRYAMDQSTTSVRALAELAGLKKSRVGELLTADGK